MSGETIESLRAELDAARADNDRLDLTARMHFGDWEREKARAEALEAENAKLRARLEALGG